MIRPHIPDLTVAEESVAIENAHILRANCFEFRVDEDSAPGRRIQVISQPMSDSKVFSSTGISTTPPLCLKCGILYLCF